MSRIAILLPDLRPGGVERVRTILAREFVAHGHEVEFVLRQAQGELVEQVSDVATIHDLGAARVRNVPLRLARYLRARRPDVLLVGMWPLTGAAVAAARLARTGTPVVMTEHTDFRRTAAVRGLHRRFLPRLMPAAVKHARAVIAVSEGVRGSLAEAGGVDPSRVAVVHNPVRHLPDPVPPPADGDAIARWTAAGLKLIAIGTLKPVKAYEVAIEALVRLPEARDANLLILGEGAERPALEARARELGIGARVHMPGFRPEPARYLALADLFVLSSRYEGFGNVILDALQMGVPVVSTDCLSGPAEILENGRHGTLVAVGDPEALARGIEAELAASRDPAALRARAADFAPDATARRYLDLMFGAA